jgi:hypothetical protein
MDWKVIEVRYTVSAQTRSRWKCAFLYLKNRLICSGFLSSVSKTQTSFVHYLSRSWYNKEVTRIYYSQEIKRLQLANAVLFKLTLPQHKTGPVFATIDDDIVVVWNISHGAIGWLATSIASSDKCPPMIKTSTLFFDKDAVRKARFDYIVPFLINDKLECICSII